MTTKTLLSTRFTAKPPIFGAGRSKLDHKFITEKYLEERNPLYVQPEDFMRGLVLWLNDDGKSAATWKDMTPGGVNNGTVYGAGTPPPATPGALGYIFDGVDDYVDAGNNSSLIMTTAVTVETWIKTTAITAYASTFLVNRLSGTLGSYVIMTDDATGLFFIIQNTGTRYSPKIPSASINDNKWHQIVGTYDNTTLRVYLDGSQIGTGTATTGNLSPPDNNLWIGRYQTGTVYVSGSIDDVRIYNRALSEREITRLFQATRGKFGI